MDADGVPTRKKIKRSSDLLNVSGSAPNLLVIKNTSSTITPAIHRMKESETVAGVKQFLEFANCQQEPTEDLNIEAVPDGEPYIEMTLGLVPLGEEDSDDEDTDISLSDSDSSDSLCEPIQDIKLPDGRYLQKRNRNNKICNSNSLIEEIEKK